MPFWGEGFGGETFLPSEASEDNVQYSQDRRERERVESVREAEREDRHRRVKGVSRWEGPMKLWDRGGVLLLAVLGHDVPTQYQGNMHGA
jgi:hypothetical protein